MPRKSTRPELAGKQLAAIPSILELALHAGMAWKAIDAMGGVVGAEGTRGQAVLFNRHEALHWLMLASRAVTLGDAVAQLYAGFQVIEALDTMELPRSYLDKNIHALRRLFLSVLPIVAAEAAIDLTDLGADDIADIANHEFPEFGA